MRDRREREFVRVDESVPFYFSPWEREESERGPLDTEHLFNELEPRDDGDPKLYELLFTINQKLDAVINHLVGTGGFNLPEARDVNISGGGARFVCQERFEVGDFLALKFFLPTHPNLVTVKSRVVRVDPAEDGYLTAVEYEDLDETVRERIIRFVFACQRLDLRHRKEHGDEGK